MKGYQITFFTQQDRQHHGKPLADWLIHLAGELNLRGASLIPVSEGVGQHHRIHSAGFFDLTDQPLMIVMVVLPDEVDRLFERLYAEDVKIFYVKAEVEFGMLRGKDGTE